jgi:O-acetyl-ADP-ribose deacetylase (regulator of RNase III)
MITYVVGDLFQSPAQVLVNAVNTVGVMGKGIAAEFKRHYPAMFEQYKTLCDNGQFEVGQLWLYKTPHKWILNFPSKRHWRNESRLEDVEAGLAKFAASFADQGITSISFPLLGAGLGGLDWTTQVRPLMEHYLGNLPLDVFIHLHEPDNRFARKTDTEIIGAWLNSPPHIPSFAQFQADMTRLVKARQQFATLDSESIFHVDYDETEGRIGLHDNSGETVIISESILSELWHYIRSAGYVWPGNLPGGLEMRAPQVIALLAEVDYLYPVFLSRGDSLGNRQIGLQLIPPPETAAPEQTVKVSRWT